MENKLNSINDCIDIEISLYKNIKAIKSGGDGSQDQSQEFQKISNKCLADVVEALIGLAYKKTGFSGS